MKYVLGGVSEAEPTVFDFDDGADVQEVVQRVADRCLLTSDITVGKSEHLVWTNWDERTGHAEYVDDRDPATDAAAFAHALEFKAHHYPFVVRLTEHMAAVLKRSRFRTPQNFATFVLFTDVCTVTVAAVVANIKHHLASNRSLKMAAYHQPPRQHLAHGASASTLGRAYTVTGVEGISFSNAANFAKAYYPGVKRITENRVAMPGTNKPGTGAQPVVIPDPDGGHSVIALAVAEPAGRHFLIDPSYTQMSTGVVGADEGPFAILDTFDGVAGQRTPWWALALLGVPSTNPFQAAREALGNDVLTDEAIMEMAGDLVDKSPWAIVANLACEKINAARQPVDAHLPGVRGWPNAQHTAAGRYVPFLH